MHGGLRCRWVPLLKSTSVYGEHGAFLDAVLRKRVVAYVTRSRELLVFDHEGKTHLPAGRIDAHESLEEGLRARSRRRPESRASGSSASSPGRRSWRGSTAPAATRATRSMR